MQQATLTGITPELVARAAAIAVDAGPGELFGETGQRRGRPPSDHLLTGRRLALYSLHREHGYPLLTLAKAFNRNRNPIRRAIAHIEQAVADGNPAICEYLTVMARLVAAWAADPPPAEDTA